MYNESRRNVLPSGVGLALVVAALYTAGMALAWTITDNAYSETDEVLADVWWVVLLLAASMLLLVRVAGLRVQRSARLGWLSLILVLPVGLSLLSAIVTLATGTTQWESVLVILGGTLLVGIGEETAFRGLVLNSLATRLTVVQAVVLSSVLFGLMHSVNAMLQSAGDTLGQVVITTLMGLSFGWVYVGSGGNLLLVVCLHWLYDFSLIAPLASTGGESLPTAVGLLLLVGTVVGTAIGLRRFKGTHWDRGTLRRP